MRALNIAVMSDTKDRGLLYQHAITEELVGFTDAD